MFEFNGLIEVTGEEHDPDIVKYGVDILTDGIITFMIILCLGVVTHRLAESLIYMIYSVCGTATMGGYHCNTRKYCLFLTIVLWILTIYMNSVSKYFFIKECSCWNVVIDDDDIYKYVGSRYDIVWSL